MFHFHTYWKGHKISGFVTISGVIETVNGCDVNWSSVFFCWPCSCISLWEVLTLSWQRSLWYRNQSIDLFYKSMDWFLYDRDLRHDRVKRQQRHQSNHWSFVEYHRFHFLQKIEISWALRGFFSKFLFEYWIIWGLT